MDRIRSNSSTWWVIAVAILLFAIWGQRFAHSAAPASAVEVRTAALKPDRIAVATTDLTGHLESLTVISRVDTKTGKLVDGPDLRATLTLRNATPDQALRLLAGRVEYVGAEGARIPLTKERGSAGFSFFPDEQGDLLPGQALSQVIRVPFPETALKANTLRDIRLHLTYRATPYRNETVEGPVTLPG